MSGAAQQQQGQVQGIEAGGLNAQLDHLDVLVSKLGALRGKQALEILSVMDAIDARIKELKQTPSSIRAEESQFETSCAALRKGAGTFLRTVGGAGVLREERQQRNPPQEAWWWYVDEIYARQQRAAIKKTVTIGVISIVVIAVLGLVYQKFFAPSPEVVAKLNALQDSQNQAGAGNYAAALTELQKGLAVVPNDSELVLMEGVVYQLQGDQQQAADAFSRARKDFSSEEDFYLTRTQDYLSVNSYALAQADAMAAIGVNPQSAIGYLLLGGAQEGLQQIAAALKSYQKAYDLSDAQGLSNVSAEAKIRMAYLLQGAGGNLPGIVTATP